MECQSREHSEAGLVEFAERARPAEWTVQVPEPAFSECLYFVKYYKFEELRQRAAGTRSALIKCNLLFSIPTLLRQGKWNEEVVGRFAKLSTPTEPMRQKAHGKGDGELARQAWHGPCCNLDRFQCQAPSHYTK